MPVTTLDPRNKSGDNPSSNFRAPSKTDINNYVQSLDLENIGADSPELTLKRARYQATRESQIPPQAEIAPESITDRDANRQVPPVSQNDQSSITGQIGEAPVDAPETQSDDTTIQTKKDLGEKEKPSDKKEEVKEKDEKKDDNDSSKDDGDTKNKDKEKLDNKPDSQGGGAEKKDPGVTPQSPPKTDDTPRKKEEAQGDENASKSDKLSSAKAQAAANLKNAQDKLKSGDIGGAVEGVTAASKIVSAWALTTMWGAVWLDWTLLTLLGLNVYFVVSNFTDKIASFGEDYLFGKWMPKELAKWFEIILMVLIDMIVLSVFFMILYGGYKFYTMSFTKTFFGYITGGKEGAIKANLD